jgi:para-nitrobenzyl esterase
MYTYYMNTHSAIENRLFGSNARGWKRKALLSLILTLMLGTATMAIYAEGLKPGAGSWQNSTTVLTSYGRIRGETAVRNTLVWRGIPYASPPVGDLRWRAPVQPKAWSGILEADRFASQSLQRLPIVGWVLGSEDSLYLNIWRPADMRTKLPVYVWIHGGGNSVGSSHGLQDYHGASLADTAGIVFVSLNYRLGPLGWLSHPALATGNPEDDSGNFGTLDIIAALRWIRDNIENFGGDASNVTIAGESAGAYNVLTLMLAPSARDLFHKAVVQSGYRTDSTPEKARSFSEDMVRALVGEAGGDIAGQLRKIDGKKILSKIKAGTAGMLSFPYPIWDGHVLPREGFAAFSDPSKVADVPLMIGTNKEETKIFQFLGMQNSKDPVYQIGAELSSARWKANGADSIADSILHGDSGKNVYLYRFDWGAPDKNGKSVLGGNAGRLLGAAHGMEISFFLQNDSILGNSVPLRLRTAKNEEGRTDLRRLMGSYLGNFMKEGNPNDPNGRLPEWKRWQESDANPFFLVFDASHTQATVRGEYGRTSIESTQSILESYEEPLKSQLREKLRW